MSGELESLVSANRTAVNSSNLVPYIVFASETSGLSYSRVESLAFLEATGALQNEAASHFTEKKGDSLQICPQRRDVR